MPSSLLNTPIGWFQPKKPWFRWTGVCFLNIRGMGLVTNCRMSSHRRLVQKNSHSKILGISRNHFYSHVQVGDMIFQTCLYVFDISQPFPSWIVLGIPSPTCHQDSLLAIPSKRASKVAMPASCLDPGRRAVSLLRHDFPFRPSHVPLKKCCQFWVINDI